MKRYMAFFLAFCLMVVAFLPAAAQAQDSDVRLWIEGSYVTSDVPPFIQYGRTMVPLRVISENLGIQVDWDEGTRTVFLVDGDMVYALQVDQMDYWAGQETRYLDAPPVIVSGRTFVPLRLIAELFHREVHWDFTNRTAIVGHGYVMPLQDEINLLSGRKMTFTSGAGAWSTNISFLDNGYFYAEYGDTDYDQRVETYFEGTLEVVSENADGSMNLVLKDLNIVSPTGQVEVRDYPEGSQTVEFVDMPYGFENSRNFILYPPDATIGNLPEDFKNWTFINQTNPENRLGVFGLYNVDQGYGMREYE